MTLVGYLIMNIVLFDCRIGDESYVGLESCVCLFDNHFCIDVDSIVAIICIKSRLGQEC